MQRQFLTTSHQQPDTRAERGPPWKGQTLLRALLSTMLCGTQYPSGQFRSAVPRVSPPNLLVLRSMFTGGYGTSSRKAQHCAGTVQQQPNHWSETDTLCVTNAQPSATPATGKEGNSIASSPSLVGSRTGPAPQLPHPLPPGGSPAPHPGEFDLGDSRQLSLGMSNVVLVKRKEHLEGYVFCCFSSCRSAEKIAKSSWNQIAVLDFCAKSLWLRAVTWRH